MILDIPPHIEQMIIATAQAQGISATEWALTALQKSIEPQTPPNDDGYYLDFDIEQMTQMIGETDENGRAKNTLVLPTGLTKAQLRTWLDENIPKHLERKSLEQGALVWR